MHSPLYFLENEACILGKSAWAGLNLALPNSSSAFTLNKSNNFFYIFVKSN